MENLQSFSFLHIYRQVTSKTTNVERAFNSITILIELFNGLSHLFHSTHHLISELLFNMIFGSCSDSIMMLHN